MKLAAVFLALSPIDTDVCGPCKVSDEGIVFVQHYEGFSPFRYRDVAGKVTIGFGHLVLPGEKLPEPMLPEEADVVLRKDLARTVTGVNQLVEVPLRQNQFDALTSWTFNLGTGSLKSSTLLLCVNAQRHAEVPPQFIRWNKARVNGKLQPVRGLTVRREAEAELYKGKAQ